MWPTIGLAPAVYRDLVAPLFTMRMPIVGFGMLFAIVSGLIFLRWRDPIIFALGASAAIVTVVRLIVISRFYQAGGSNQPMAGLVRWETVYTALTFVFAALLAGLNVRVLMVHDPLMLTGTISLVYTFGAGVVSRTACRPRLCTGSLLIAVLPTALAMLWHAAEPDEQALHGEFFLMLAFLLLAVLGMSLDSVRHLYAATLEQLVTRHDLAKLARVDALTGLPNRLMLREAYQTRLEAAQRTGSQLAIHYLDLDGFKAVNDQSGHPAGDRMLREVALRLQGTIRSDDVAFRLGGDEFLLMQAAVAHRDEAELLARRVIKHLSEPYVIDGQDMRISVSVGIALAASFECDLDDLVASADAALYRSKARGKAQLHFANGDAGPTAAGAGSGGLDLREAAAPIV
ncbi:diguanylate cyclase (GGDEF)-like protein [Novosphingobium chloroacetimidivorans]|uniref:Diguanylate cyclase (GGDEF)-like protein n=1 Tax=Novosphingobium chloroacetimidivorans TaxID=1428314 RepID=A0A7W7K9Q8_9SPHN|nr:GGDEF domain-containing protein [Novosphingobium chloroacetimidivorans]MBB4858309.1 diguanylate cyclase (GGDEF)-like protein [Novosphingobium chloroacetimidivorans]